MERRIQPHRAVVAEPTDSTFKQNLGLSLSTNTTESEDTNMEEEEKMEQNEDNQVIWN